MITWCLVVIPYKNRTGSWLDTMISVQTAESILSNSDKLLTGMRKYKKIMDALYWTDVSVDRDFQRMFHLNQPKNI